MHGNYAGESISCYHGNHVMYHTIHIHHSPLQDDYVVYSYIIYLVLNLSACLQELASYLAIRINTGSCRSSVISYIL